MTLKVTEKRNPNAEAQLQSLIDNVLLGMAEAGAEELRDNLSPGPRSGVHYAGQPRVSSAPSEFSQEQTGTLRNMVGSGMVEPGVAYFGLEPKTPEEEEEARAQEDGAPRNNLVGRANVRRTALSPRTHRRMKAVRRPR